MEKKNEVATVDEIHDNYESLWKKPFDPIKESELFHSEIVFLMENLKRLEQELLKAARIYMRLKFLKE